MSTNQGRDPILVVEDDPAIRESFQLLLEFEGYSVLTAANGKQALQILRNNPRVRLILLDLMMPVMNGWEFLDAKQKNPGFSGVPVIIISAAKFGEKIRGAKEVLLKPVNLDSLVESIKTSA